MQAKSASASAGGRAAARRGPSKGAALLPLAPLAASLRGRHVVMASRAAVPHHPATTASSSSVSSTHASQQRAAALSSGASGLLEAATTNATSPLAELLSTLQQQQGQLAHADAQAHLQHQPARQANGANGAVAAQQQQQQQQRQQHPARAPREHEAAHEAAAAQAPVDLESRAVGCLVGALCGNALGAPVQHDKHWQVARMFPYGLTEFWSYDLASRPTKRGQVTGDALWMLAVAGSLVAARTCDARAVAQQLAERCNPDGGLDDLGSSDPPSSSSSTTADSDMTAAAAAAVANHPRRYNPHAQQLLRRLRTPGASVDDLRWLAQQPALAAQLWAALDGAPGSSFADRWEREPWGPADYGAAVGVAAPLAVAYLGAGARGEEEEARRWALLDEAVQEACLVSHSHPAGVDGARVVAAAAQWLMRRQAGGARPEQLLRYLEERVAQTDDMRGKLALLRRELFQVEEIQSYRAFFKGAQWHRLVRVLSRVTYHDMATAGTEAAAVALWALATNWSRPKQAVCLAATFGGSAPATALLAGALAGALHGREWIPSTWWEGLEDAPGVADPAAGVRGDAVALAQQLAQLGCAQVGMPAPAQQ